MLLYCCFLCFFLLQIVVADKSNRTLTSTDPILLFQEKSVFQFTVGVSMPIIMDEKGGVSFDYGFQFNYALPWNSSQLETMVVQARDNTVSSLQGFDLTILYRSLENLLERFGWRNGRACLLKTICQLAVTPIDRSGDDVIEELIHLLLTPSENEEDRYDRNELLVYEEAEQLGKRRGIEGCNFVYSSCDDSPIDLFTDLVS